MVLVVALFSDSLAPLNQNATLMATGDRLVQTSSILNLSAINPPLERRHVRGMKHGAIYYKTADISRLHPTSFNLVQTIAPPRHSPPTPSTQHRLPILLMRNSKPVYPLLPTIKSVPRLFYNVEYLKHLLLRILPGQREHA